MNKMALRFDLTARQGMLKNPMTSRGVNLTFTNLHVVALKGILGAILGFDGKLKLYNTQQDLLFKEQKEPLKINQMIPENLLKLEGLEYSIIPNLSEGNFLKRVYTTNNTTGLNIYSKKTASATNIILKDELLENVHYNVYIYDTSPYYAELKDCLVNSLAAYPIFLGQRQYPLNISNIEEIVMEETINYDKVDSLYKKSNAIFDGKANKYLDNVEYFSEAIPSGLSYETTLYEYDEYVVTNSYIESYSDPVYKDKVTGHILAVLS